MTTKAERNRYRTDGIYCHRCGDKLNDAKAVWLVLSCTTGHFYATDAEADATGCNQGGFAFGRACARNQLKDTRGAEQKAQDMRFKIAGFIADRELNGV